MWSFFRPFHVSRSPSWRDLEGKTMASCLDMTTSPSPLGLGLKQDLYWHTSTHPLCLYCAAWIYRQAANKLRKWPRRTHCEGGELWSAHNSNIASIFSLRKIARSSQNHRYFALSIILQILRFDLALVVLLSYNSRSWIEVAKQEDYFAHAPALLQHAQAGVGHAGRATGDGHNCFSSARHGDVGQCVQGEEQQQH